MIEGVRGRGKHQCGLGECRDGGGAHDPNRLVAVVHVNVVRHHSGNTGLDVVNKFALYPWLLIPNAARHRESVFPELGFHKPEESLHASPCQETVLGEDRLASGQREWRYPILGQCPRHGAGSVHDHRTTQVALLPVRTETLEDDARCAEVPHPSIGGSPRCSDCHFSDFAGRLGSGEGNCG